MPLTNGTSLSNGTPSTNGARSWRNRRSHVIGKGRALALLLVVSMMLSLPGGVLAQAAAPAVSRVDAVRLAAADAQGATVEFVTPKFSLRTGEAQVAVGAQAGCQAIVADGLAQTADAGRPQLPVKTVLLGVPPAAMLELNVTAGESRTLATGTDVCASVRSASAPDAGDATAADSATAIVERDAAVYGRDAFYPAETVRLVDLGFMRSQRIVRVEFYPFQYNPATGELRESVSLTAQVRFNGDGVTSGDASGAAVVEPADWEQSFRDLLLNYDAATSLRAAPSASAAAAGWAPPQPGYKLAVKDEGIYRLTRASLAAAGLPVDTLDPRTFRLYNNKAEVAIRVTGEADGRFDAADEVVFYGRGVDTRYTDTNIYWLTYGGVQGKRMGARASTAGGAAVTSFLTTVKKEDNTTYDSNLPMLPGYDHWFGQQITAAGAGKSGAVSVTLATPQLGPTTSAASQISVMLGAVTTGSHHVRLYVNPTLYPASVFDGTWDDATVFLASAELPQSHLNASGNNVVKIEIVNDFEGRAADVVRLDWVKLGYQRAFVAENDKLLFGGDAVLPDAAGPRQYTVSGFSTGNVDVYDVTDPANVVAISGAQAAGVAGSDATLAPQVAPQVAVQFGDNLGAPRRYAAFERAQQMTPSIAYDKPSTLQSMTMGPGAVGADYIIVTHADFAAALPPLVQLRGGTRRVFLPTVMRSANLKTAATATLPVAEPTAVAGVQGQGMRVQVVDVQDIYDEFGGGLMSAEAIRDFLAYAYANWTRPAPAYVLLVGDGTYDFRNYKSADRTFVPPYLDLVDPDAGETATDNRFVAVTQAGGTYDILPDMHVGRLPASTLAEATAMVNKIVAYETKAPRPWTKQVAFVADDLEGGGGDFYAYSDGIADGTALYNSKQVKILPADYTPNKIYLGKTCDLSNPSQSVECRQQIVDKLNSGSLLVSYIGHGVKTYWAAERLYDANSLNSLSNPGKLPVMLPMTCNEGYFIDPGDPSLSELGVRMPDKGVIASWSPTGFGLAPGHDYLQRGLFLALFQEAKPLGSAATAAKLYLVANAPANSYRDLIDTFLLLGDPALRVAN